VVLTLRRALQLGMKMHLLIEEREVIMLGREREQEVVLAEI
jgi:hypothetical protein